MVDVEHLLFCGLVLVWPVILGVIDFGNKLYVFMIMWVVLTYITSCYIGLEYTLMLVACAVLCKIAS
jgi:hypothetical protein